MEPREAHPAMHRLRRLNPTVVFLVTALLIFAALALPGSVGGVMLLAMAAALGWLLAQTWLLQPVRTRSLRIVILGALVALALARLFA